MLVSQSGSDASTYGRALLLFLLMATATAAWLGVNLAFPEIQPACHGPASAAISSCGSGWRWLCL
jgi:hypothetical protein